MLHSGWLWFVLYLFGACAAFFVLHVANAEITEDQDGIEICAVACALWPITILITIIALLCWTLKQAAKKTRAFIDLKMEEAKEKEEEKEDQ